MATKVKINHAEMTRLLRGEGSYSGIRKMLEEKGEKVASAASASAPVESGDYKASIRAELDVHPSRAAVHVGAHVDYGMEVEARHGTLARSLGAAR